MIRIQPGQTWVRTRDGSRIEIVSVDGTFDDVTYRRIYPSGEKSRTQEIFGFNLRKRYELAADQ